MKTKFPTIPTIVLAALLFAGLPLASSSAYVAVSVGIAPPSIPIYEQPYCPAEGYIWTPGYWAYADFGYYWVPGVWVAPPRVGLLWTPGYWGYRGGRYAFYDGYWGPTVGFYGGINYGFGYTGRGYYGGEWVGNSFRYNTAVTRVNTTVIHNTYVNNKVPKTGSRASFNGPGGAKAKPTAQEKAVTKAEHVPPTTEQRSRVEAAKKDPALHAANNHGKPKPEAVKALDRKTGPETAAAGGAAGSETNAGPKKQGNDERQAGAGKAKDAAGQDANGNSAFGHKQGDSTTRTTESQNNAYGKAQSADAQESPPKSKAGRTEEATASHARKAGSHNGETRKVTSAPRAAQRPQAAPHRPRPVVARQASPGAGDNGPAGAPQKAKKKKKKPAER